MLPFRVHHHARRAALLIALAVAVAVMALGLSAGAGRAAAANWALLAGVVVMAAALGLESGYSIDAGGITVWRGAGTLRLPLTRIAAAHLPAAGLWLELHNGGRIDLPGGDRPGLRAALAATGIEIFSG